MTLFYKPNKGIFRTSEAKFFVAMCVITFFNENAFATIILAESTLCVK